MNRNIILFLALFPIGAFSNTCSEIAKYDEPNSEIYVVCPDLPIKSTPELIAIVHAIFTKNTLQPDEYTIDFVTSKQFLTQESLKKENHVGFYYTHNGELVIWPKNQETTRNVKLRN